MDDNVKAAVPKMQPVEHMRSTRAREIAEAAIEVTALLERREAIRSDLRRLDVRAARARDDLAAIDTLLRAASDALSDAAGSVVA